MPFLAVIISGLLWTLATQLFSHIGRNISVFRLNFYKTLIAGPLFFLSALLWGRLVTTPTVFFILFVSGVLGSALADLFYFKAMAGMGAARALIIISFGPFVVAIWSYFFLGQGLTFFKLLGLGCLFFCVLFLSHEKKNGGVFSWWLCGIAVAGLLVDSLAMVAAKYVFTIDPELGPLGLTAWRILAASFFMLGVCVFRGQPLGIADVNKKIRGMILLSCSLGSFLALAFFMWAIEQIPNPAITCGLGGLTPVWASVYEHIRDRRVPSLYFVGALFLMLTGVGLLVWGW